MEHIARELARERIKNWNGTTIWHPTTLQSMLENEKYKGDAILQKSYTVDFLTKKRVKNEGELQKYYVEKSHEAIIDLKHGNVHSLRWKEERNIWLYGLSTYLHNTENNPFASKAICGSCNKAFVMAWNVMVENKKHFIEKWKNISLEDDLLLAYRAKKFLKIVKEIGLIERMDLDFMLETLGHIKIFEDGFILVMFQDGMRLNVKMNSR